jgi:hypothetical protein
LVVEGEGGHRQAEQQPADREELAAAADRAVLDPALYMGPGARQGVEALLQARAALAPGPGGDDPEDRGRQERHDEAEGADGEAQAAQQEQSVAAGPLEHARARGDGGCRGVAGARGHDAGPFW